MVKKIFRQVLFSYLLISSTVCLAQTTALDTVFNTNKTPIWDYVFLRNTTKEFLETAKGLEQNLINFEERLANDQERELVLRQAVEMADLNRTIADLGISYAQQSKAIAVKNADIANLRTENKDRQIRDGSASLRFMKKSMMKSQVEDFGGK